jgi:hypothetical protein
VPKRSRNPVAKHVLVIRRSLTAIDRSLGRLVAATNGRGRGEVAERPARRRKLALSPKRRAELELQGRYMGCLRNLRPGQKKLVKAVRAAKGIRAAIAKAKTLAAG